MVGPVPVLSDAYGYASMSWTLVNEGTYSYLGGGPDAVVTPGYPLWLALFFTFVPEGTGLIDSIKIAHPWVVGCQLILAISTVAVVTVTARKLAGRVVGFVAGVGVALYLPLFWYATVLLTESLATFLVTLLVALSLLTAAADRSGSEKQWAAFGALLAVTTLVRPAYALWGVVPPLVMLAQRRIGMACAFRYTVVIFTAFSIAMSPWWVRNVIVFDKFIPLSMGASNALLDSVGGSTMTPRESEVLRSFGADDLAGRKAVAMMRIRAELSSDAIGFIAKRIKQAAEVPYQISEAQTFTAAILENPAFSHIPVAHVGVGLQYEIGQTFTRAASIAKEYHHLLIRLALIGLLAIYRHRQLAILACFPAYTVLIHSPVLFHARYFFPAMPTVIAFAVLASFALLRQHVNGRSETCGSSDRNLYIR